MKRYIPYIVIAALILVIWHQCERNTDNESRYNANVEALTDSVRYHKLKNGNVVAEKKALLLTNKELKEVLLEKDENLRLMAKEYAKIKSAYTFKSEIKIPELKFAFDEPIVLDSLGRFERTGAKFTDWYSLGYKVTNDSLTIEPFYTWTETKLVTGTKRKWFLGKETLTTSIVNTNPFIEVTEITGAEVVIKKQWYEKWYVWAAVGAAGGYFIAK
ncbi:DUF6549 family protein [Flavobacterium coralii]|uniref:DUF6549 family protein n=1 Tax=Flavobacterium coralii TaxID=2838017 RepID=UPI0032B18E9B